MKNIRWKSLSLAALTALTGLLPLTATHGQTTVRVVEYFNVKANAFFITGRADEQAVLDTVADFKRTGASFTARPASAATGNFQPICRYRIEVTPTFFSHFYGLPTDCNNVAAAIRAGTVTNFFDEGLDFAVEPATAGVCPASSPVAIRRALRLGTPVESPNHRYTTNLVDYQDQTVQNWSGENIVFCGANATAATPRPNYSADASAAARCEVPRTGTSPRTGAAYPDVAGTRDDEKAFVRHWFDRTYLWYREMTNAPITPTETPAAYFSKLKTPALATSGGPKDRFSFSQSTANVDNTNAGVIFGYGVEWAALKSTPPRNWVAAIVDPGSPAELAGVRRGDKILQVDGVDFVNGNNVNPLNRGLFPQLLGEPHSLQLQGPDGAIRSVSLISASLPLISVPKSGVLTTPTGKVGYIAFTTFGSYTAEKAIADAVAGIATQGISDLVLDLRYNGGGYVFISAQLAYMVAGSAKSSNKVFEKTLYNDKNRSEEEIFPFINVGLGVPGGLAENQPLPQLNLNRVFVLTSGETCSASESFINALRGIDVQVILIGDTTCGKPYGFSGKDNCGTTYYPIQFSGVNNKGAGDFVNGLAATCTAADDLNKQLGDPTERQLAAALTYRATGSCPRATGSEKSAKIPAVAGSEVAVEERALRQMKLLVPADTQRSGIGIITPRAPLDLGRFSLPSETR